MIVARVIAIIPHTIRSVGVKELSLISIGSWCAHSLEMSCERSGDVSKQPLGIFESGKVYEIAHYSEKL